MNKPLLIGVTGGIGTGKTIVCKIFNLLGVPVFNADQQARALMQYNNELIRQLILLFGKDALLPDGQINRRHIGEIVFNDRKALEKLNGLVHPYVNDAFIKWTADHNKHPLLIREAAIMIESGTYHDLDKIIVIEATYAVRIKRVSERDGKSEELIDAIIKNQMPAEQLRQFADFIIINDESKLVIPQVIDIFEKLTQGN